MKMNNKQSSIEWLVSQLKQYDFAHSNLEYYDLKIPMHIFKNITEQAKAMHKEEIEETYQKGYNDADFSYYEPEQYYNETFGGNNEN